MALTMAARSRAAAGAAPRALLHRQTGAALPRDRNFSTSAQRHALFTGMSEADLTPTQLDVRHGILALLNAPASSSRPRFDDAYWLERDRTSSYPHDFYDAVRSAGFVGTRVPAQYGGAGLGLAEALVLLQTIAESGAGISGAQAVHANVYPVVTIVKAGTEAQRREWLPRVLSGEMRTCFGVTEPGVGSETLKLSTQAERRGDEYVVNGQKVWTSSAQVASHCVLLVRTSPPTEGARSAGLSLLFAPLRAKPDDGRHSHEESALLPGVQMARIDKMGGGAIDANEVWFDDARVPASHLIGPKSSGWRTILAGMNAERILIAGEALGNGYAALRRATSYAAERVLFSRAIGGFQGVQHRLAEVYARLEAARYLTYAAARAYDRAEAEGEADVAGGSRPGPAGDARRAAMEEVGALANAAKLTAAEAGHEACRAAVLTLGGMGYAKEQHVERYLRESFVPLLAPISREMVLSYLGQRVLGLPRSY